ncbi:hypothetical protein Hanom_Chr09g00781011 [Helianthus anomalus]
MFDTRSPHQSSQKTLWSTIIIDLTTPVVPMRFTPFVWKHKQGDTFSNFTTCCEWFMGTFPPAEVLHHKQRKHEQLYQSHVVVQANQLSTGNQIMREWRTMHRERAEWEAFRSRLAADAKQFEKAKLIWLKKRFN